MIVDFKEIWNELLEQDHVSTGRPVGRWVGGVVVASVSAGNTPELIIQIAGWDFSNPLAVQSSLRLKGFDIWYQVMQVGLNQSPCLILKPRTNYSDEMFYALASHLVASLPNIKNTPNAPNDIESIIETWADFWKKLREPADRKKILGLLGELLAIDRWLDKETLQYSDWQGPIGGPHDFCGERFDLEVKVTGSRTGALKHEISSIHQLESQVDKALFILSFRLGLSKTGAHSAHELVARISKSPIFTSPAAATWLADALSEAGYSTELDAELSHFDLWEEALYEVKEGFPRLTRTMLPEDSRIFDLSYSINFGGCQEYLVTSEPISLKTWNTIRA